MTTEGSYTHLTEPAACASLVEAGLNLSPVQVRLEARQDRWLVSLPDDRLALFPANDRGRERLAVGRRVLRLLAHQARSPRLELRPSDMPTGIRQAA
jgi:hypothetical protein